MCLIQRGLVSKTEGGNMTEVGHHGGGSNQGGDQGSVAARQSVLSRLRALFQVSSICFRKELLFLCAMAFMLIHAHAEEQTGLCNPSIMWGMRSDFVNFEMRGLCPCSSSIEQFPEQRMNINVPHAHINAEDLSPEALGTPSPSRADVKIVVTVLAIIGSGLAGWMLYKHRRAFTEADVNRGLMRGPAVPTRNDPTFKIHPSIDGIAN